VARLDGGSAGEKKRLRNKKASTPGLNCQSGWPQTLPFISPSVGTVPVPCYASYYARSRFDDGGGLLRADKYHRRRVCQHGNTAHNLIDGEFSSILALLASSIASGPANPVIENHFEYLRANPAEKYHGSFNFLAALLRANDFNAASAKT
jgi:hypothetical protein